MAKMTIYVPDDLKSRMDETKGVNWSPLACQAFESKIAEIITTGGPRDMKDAIARLRASRSASKRDISQDGVVAGRVWAMGVAEAIWLERLADHYDNCEYESNWEAMFNTDMNDPFDISYKIMTNEDSDRKTAYGFWESQLGEENYRLATQEVDFFESFLRSAIEFWDKVKDQL